MSASDQLLDRPCHAAMANTHPQPHCAFDGYAAANAVTARVYAEGWTADDVKAAFLQSCLLSYQSRPISAEERAQSQWNQVWNPDGQRYVESSPVTYEHNCPWNDWTPPSQSLRLFEAANAANAEAAPYGVRARVRINVCLSADSRACGNKMLIAFASVEVDDQGTKALVLRRGAEVLAHMPMHAIAVHQEPTHERILHVVAISATAVSLCLYIENARRLDAFLALFR
jgi:hypothetical protein